MNETASTPEGNRNFFKLESKKARVVYFFSSTIIVLALRMLETAIHEFSHAITAIAAGGSLKEDPFLITPFGGYTRWQDVPDAFLPLVNISGTLVAACFLLCTSIPLFYKSTRNWMRFMGYWFIVILVNSLFYWLVSPFIGTASHFDPVAFATHVGIDPPWIIGLVVAVPFSFAVYWMVRATRKLREEVLTDPTRFHLKCLIFYYTISIFFPVVSYLNLLDQFRWW